MRKYKRIKTAIHLLILGMAVGLIATIQTYVSAQSTTVSDAQGFMAALEDESKRIIELDGEIVLEKRNDANAPLVINRSVTIKGGELSLWQAGIVLGGDVTFERVRIGFRNSTRNAIIANGYALTLDNVSQSGSFGIDLFCGGLANYSGLDVNTIPGEGNSGRIVIKGENHLGNIYAGSFSDGSSNDAASTNAFTKAAEITVESDASGTIGSIYAYGKSAVGNEGEQTASAAAVNTASGGVTIHLNNQLIKAVYGTTGSSSDAAVIYTDNGSGSLYSPLLQGIGSLTLKGNKTNLAPQNDSSFSPSGGTVVLSEHTMLDVRTMAAPVSLSALSGEGTLILGEDQTLAISDRTDGKTALAIGGVSEDGKLSLGTIRKDHIYIQAPNSTEGSFILLPSQAFPNAVLNRDANGNWSVGETEISALPEDSVLPIDGGISHVYDGMAFSLSMDKGTHLKWNGTGKASILGYYLDKGTTPTTEQNSGALNNGAAPVNAGSYYGKVTVAADGTYTETTAYIPFTIQKGELSLQSLPVVSPISPGRPLSEAKINDGIVVVKGTNTEVFGSWSWTDSTIKPSQTGEYMAVFTPKTASNFNSLLEQKLSVTVDEILKAYTVNYNAGGGSGTMANGTAIEGTAFTLPTCKFTPPKGKVFAGWLIRGKKYTAGETYVFTANTQVTATWKDASGNQTNSGTKPAGSVSANTVSGNSADTSNRGTGANTVSVYGTKNSVNLKVSVSGSTATVNALSQNEATHVLSGHSTNGVVTFDVSGAGKSINGVNLSRSDLKAFAESSNNGGLRINLTTGSVKLDMKALKAIVDQSDGDTVRLVIDNSGTSLLNDKQKKSCENMQLHGGAEIYFVSTKDNKRISDLKGGMMTVSVPFSIPSGLSSGEFMVWYIDENGTRTKLTSWYEGYKMHWQVGHNSSFIISRGSGSGSTTATPVNPSVKSPKTGENSTSISPYGVTVFILGGVVLPVVTIIGGTILYKRRVQSKNRK